MPAGRYYTEKENNWLRENSHLFSLCDLTKQFNLNFPNRTQCSIEKQCFRLNIHFIPERTPYTENELNWLKNNYGINESRKETYKKFTDIFGHKHSLNSMICTAKKYKWASKPNRHYETGHVTWNTGLTKTDIKSHFTSESWKNMLDSLFYNGYSGARHKYNVPDGYVLSENKLIIPYKIYKRLSWLKLIGYGELTETAMYVALARDKINDLQNRILFVPDF